MNKSQGRFNISDEVRVIPIKKGFFYGLRKLFWKIISPKRSKLQGRKGFIGSKDKLLMPFESTSKYIYSVYFTKKYSENGKEMEECIVAAFFGDEIEEFPQS